MANGGTGTATAFTTGSVIFAGASGTYTQDNANFFWDNTNDRLGVGNAAPSTRLHAQGASDYSGTSSYSPVVTINSFDGYQGSLITGTLGSRFTSYNVRQGLKISSEASLTFHALNYDFDWQMGTVTAANEANDTNLKMRLTNVGNLKIGGVAARGTTEGTNQLVLFNGTAPGGTLTNGGSIFCAGGEIKVADAAGNITQISPHDKLGNWIHDETNYMGRRLRVDLERMLAALDDMLFEKLGERFVESYLIDKNIIRFYG